MGPKTFDINYHLAPAAVMPLDWHSISNVVPLLLITLLAYLITARGAFSNVRSLLLKGSALPGIASFGPPFFGAAMLFLARKRSLPAILHRLTKLGGTDGIAYAWVGLSLIVAVEDPVLSHEVLRRAEKVTRDGDFNLVSPISSIRRILKETLFTHDNATAKGIKDWAHSLVGQKSTVAEYNQLIMNIAAKHVQLFVHDHDVELHGRCSVHDMLDDFAADMWTQIFFGVRVLPNELRKMCATVTDMNSAITQPMQLFKHALWSVCHPIQASHGVTNPVEADIQDKIRTFVQQLIIQAFQHEETLLDDDGNPLPTSILSKLRDARRACLTDSELEEELNDLSRAIIFAGFQSTRRWIGWALKYLQQRPDILAELRQELASPGVFDIGSLRGFSKTKGSTTLFDAVLEEVGRLHAPTFAKFRVLAEPMDLVTKTGKNVKLEKDTLVVCVSHYSQHALTDIRLVLLLNKCKRTRRSGDPMPSTSALIASWRSRHSNRDVHICPLAMARVLVRLLQATSQ